MIEKLFTLDIIKKNYIPEVKSPQGGNKNTDEYANLHR